jgi:hypothetical protein
MWAAIVLFWGWRTTHVLLAAGVIEGRKRLGQQPSHVTWGSARYSRRLRCIATPYLYWNVTNKKSLHTLLSTIAKFPGCAKHVQRIHWSRDRTADYSKFSATAPRHRILEQMRLLGLRFGTRNNYFRIQESYYRWTSPPSYCVSHRTCSF